MKSPPDDLAVDLLGRTDLILRRDPVAKFDEVAAAVGRSRAALYYYFAGRDDLVAFVLRAHVEGGAATMAAADPGSGTAAARLRAVLAAALGYLAARPQVCAGLLSAATATGAMAEVMAMNDRHVAAPIRALLADGRTDGTLAASAADTAADAILGALLVAVIGRWSRGGDLDAEAFGTAVVDQLMAGVTVPGR